ncbi:MAG: hypothetical protein JWM59_3630 [Verrucomicrobiales bacterium]|nr:hypothetical protein [Verrucomicrobiales bacterium]
MAAVNLTGGRLRWTRTLGPSGAVDRPPSCVPLGSDRFAVVTATGDVRTFSIDGTLLHAVRPAGEFLPVDAATRMAGPLWELQRLDARRLIVFSGESPELGRNVSSPICCLGIEQGETMKCLWTSFKTRGPVAPAAVGSNIYLHNASGLTAYSPETGKALWDKTNEDAAINCAWSAPLVHGGFVYLATEDGLAIYRDAAECVPVGTVEFTNRKPGRSRYTNDMPHGYAPPVIYDGTLYVTANAKLLALKLPLFPLGTPVVFAARFSSACHSGPPVVGNPTKSAQITGPERNRLFRVSHELRGQPNNRYYCVRAPKSVPVIGSG